MNHHESQARAPRFTPVRVLAVCCLSATLGPAVCSVHGQPVPDKRDFRGLDAADRASRPGQPQTQGARTDRRAAMGAGAPVLWDELEPIMAEAAGGQALQEIILDRMLAAEFRTRGLSITNEDIARERNYITEQIAQDAQATPEETERLLAAVRKRRGLGPVRFERLLERTARMRKLVTESVVITDDEMKQAYDMRHGPRYRSRVVMTDSDRKAAEIRTALEQASPDQRTARLAEIAAKSSIDPSASRGGMLEPISPADPAYPAGVRAALPRMQPGELSQVIAVDRGFVVLLLEEIISGDSKPFAEAKPAIERDVRLKRERLAMDDLARRLIRNADVSVMDRSLDWAWRNAIAESAP